MDIDEIPITEDTLLSTLEEFIYKFLRLIWFYGATFE